MLFSYKKYHAVKELELIRKNNLGSFYNYVNKKLNSRSHIPEWSYIVIFVMKMEICVLIIQQNALCLIIFCQCR